MSNSPQPSSLTTSSFSTCLNNLALALANESSLNNGTNLTKSLPSYAENVSSLINSSVFVVAFIAFYFLIIFFFGYKGRKMAMKTNQKLLLFLVSLFVFIQLMCLIFRIVYNGMALKFNGQPYQVVVLDAYLIIMHLFGSLETMLSDGQTISIFVIQFFIQMVL